MVHHIEAWARMVDKGLYEVTWPAFPDASVLVEAPDAEEALRRTMTAVVGLVTRA